MNQGNFLLFRSSDPLRIKAVAERARAEFSTVWIPHPNYVLAETPLTHLNGPTTPFVKSDVGSNVVIGEANDFTALQLRRTPTPHGFTQLHHLPGDFTFARVLVDGHAEVVRAVAGVVPVYVWRSGQETAFFTRLAFRQLVATSELRLDPLTLACWGSMIDVFPNSQTSVTDVKILEAGTAHFLDPSGTVWTRTYWKEPESFLQRSELPDVCQMFRTLFIENLRRNLAPQGRNLIAVSGGVDSSVVVSVARKTLHAELSTLSFLPVGPPGIKEERWIRPLLAELGVRHQTFLHYDGLADIPQSLRQPPSLAMTSHPTLQALPSLRREHGPRVLFGGEYGDRLWGGTSQTLPDLFQSPRTGRLLFQTPCLRLPTLGKLALRAAARRFMLAPANAALPPNLYGIVRENLKADYRDWRSSVLSNAQKAPRPFLMARLSCAAVPTWGWEVGSSLGFGRCLPFFSRELLELALSIPAGEHFGRQSKQILRSAFEGEVRGANLHRADRGYGYPRGRSMVWAWPVREKLAAIFCPALLPEVGDRVPARYGLPLAGILNIVRAS